METFRKLVRYIIRRTYQTINEAIRLSLNPVVKTFGVVLFFFLILLTPSVALAKETLTITADYKTRLYAAENPPWTFTFSKEGVTVDDIDVLPTVTCSAVPSSDAGFYDIILSEGSDDEYDLKLVNGTLKVEKLLSSEINVNIQSVDTTYNGTEYPVKVEVKPGTNEYGKEVDIDPSIIKVSVTYPGLPSQYKAPQNAGEYQAKIQVIDENVNGWNQIMYEWVDIAKAPLTVQAKNIERLENTENPEFEVIYDKLLGSDTPISLDVPVKVSCAAEKSSPTGEYPIIIEEVEDQNYEITKINGTLTVIDANSRASLTLEDKTYTYDGTGKAITYTIDPELEVAVTYNGKTAIPIDAGTYNVVVKVDDDDYTGTPVEKTAQLIIKKAPLTITADDKDKLLYEPVDELTMSFDGFVNGETKEVLDELPKISSEVTTESLPGQYPITIEGGKDNNYTIQLQNGTYTVDSEVYKAPPTSVEITFGNLEFEYDGFPHEPEIFTEPENVSMEVSYNGSFTPPTSVGTHTLSVFITDPDFEGQKDTIMNISPKILEFEAANVIIVNGMNPTTFQIKEIDNYFNNSIAIYSRSGTLIFEQDNYKNNFSMAELPSGTYFYVFTHEQGAEKSFVEVIHP